MKNLLLTVSVILSCFFSLNTQSQQDPQYTQYMYNMSVVNPAYAGSKEATSIGVLGRKQWVGTSGAPTIYTAFMHSPLGKNLGLGLSLISDKIGPVSETTTFIDFSYTIRVSEKAKLAFGLKAGAVFQNIGILDLNQVQTGDTTFDENVNNVHPNFGFGMFYYNKMFYLGASIPNLLSSLHFEKSNGVITKASENKHYFITSGYVFDLTEEFKFKPSAMAKFAKHTPLSLDLSMNILWKEKLEFGISHRFDDSWSGLINMKVNDSLRIGYAYDHTTSNLGTFNSGSHEILLLFDFVFTNNNYKSPRFF